MPNAPAAKTNFSWPLKGKVIASFGQTVDHTVNRGLNIQPGRNLNIHAADSGKVIFCSQNFKGFGKTVILEHAQGFLTVYAKNSKILVKPGDNIAADSVIARTGAYLHFEIRKGYLAQDPLSYLTPKE